MLLNCVGSKNFRLKVIIENFRERVMEKGRERERERMRAARGNEGEKLRR